ncbi:hypothetical protein F5148DRAFT_1169706 [Russula earlei]|uniref:Uncharacterized protein n=1 Tax=Russula earlei TaxID=71964 RepID=A0ACC0ULI2_9AGAM|nr:hypothetical protein F5148DRAFT_1169706 [Russula earlei]
MNVLVPRHPENPFSQPQSTNHSGFAYANQLSGVPFTSFESGFISAIVGAAFLSAVSVLLLLWIYFYHPPSRLGNKTHVPVIFGSLLASNFLQAIGTIINVQWVALNGVSPGTLCSMQAGIKQAGNVGTAIWSFDLALLAFSLLFLRTRLSTRSMWLMLALGWAFMVFVVVIGPLAIQKDTIGPYFGPAGFWCWITESYPFSQVFLEYMFEWTSALLCLFLYVTVFLRVRGNLIQDTTGNWSLQWVIRSESWQLGCARDYLDSSTMKMVRVIVWYPVTYTVLIVPISIGRFASYAGARVPHGFTFLADFIFALGGFVNLVLFLGTWRSMPDPSTIPDFSTPRSHTDKVSLQRGGITPFVLTSRDAEEVPEVMASASDGEASVSCSEKDMETETLEHHSSTDSHVSDARSQLSTLPLSPRR